MPDEPVLLGTRRTPSEQNALDEYMLGFISRDELIKRLDQLKEMRAREHCVTEPGGGSMPLSESGRRP